MAAIDAPPPALPPSMLAAMADEALVGLVAAGSDDAFAALDERYRRRLVRFARGFVPGGDADAEDVVPDAMVRAVRAPRHGSRAPHPPPPTPPPPPPRPPRTPRRPSSARSACAAWSPTSAASPTRSAPRSCSAS